MPKLYVMFPVYSASTLHFQGKQLESWEFVVITNSHSQKHIAKHSCIYFTYSCVSYKMLFPDSNTSSSIYINRTTTSQSRRLICHLSKQSAINKYVAQTTGHVSFSVKFWLTIQQSDRDRKKKNPGTFLHQSTVTEARMRWNTFEPLDHFSHLTLKFMLQS